MRYGDRSAAGRGTGPTRRIVLGGALAAAGAALSARGAFAEDAYPSRPIHVIVPFGPGGLADVTVRIAAEQMKSLLGQPLVIENHPGAGGIAAASAALKGGPDGYSLIVLSNGTTIATSLFSHLPYNPQTQFTPISTVAWFDLILFTNVNSPYKSVKELLDDARKKPGSLNIGTVIAPAARRSCSASPIVPCRRSSACGGRSAAAPEYRHAPSPPVMAELASAMTSRSRISPPTTDPGSHRQRPAAHCG